MDKHDTDKTETSSVLRPAAGSDFHEELWQDAVALLDGLKPDRWVTPYLQRRLRIGYNRAARIAERMDELGMTVEQRIPSQNTDIAHSEQTTKG